MIKMLKKFINNKYFYIWLVLLLIILYMFYGFFWSGISNYMMYNEIEDKMYIFYVYTLPMTFSNSNYMFCFLLDLLYITVLLYPSVSFVDYFFNQNATTSITRISREKWIKQFINVNLICSITIAIIYILLYYILGRIENVDVELGFKTINNYLPILYKFLISCIVPVIYIYMYIKTDNSGISLGFTIFAHILLQTIIKIMFDIEKLQFNNPIYYTGLFIVLYLLMRSLSIKSFKRRDI